MTELIKCEFCKGKSLVIGQTIYHDAYFVKCLECKAQGPQKREKAEAILAWNRRGEE